MLVKQSSAFIVILVLSMLSIVTIGIINNKQKYNQFYRE